MGRHRCRYPAWLVALVTAGLLGFAWEARPSAPELAGAIAAGVINHWLPARFDEDRQDVAGATTVKEVA